MDIEKIEAALLEQVEINKELVTELARLGAARFAHRRIIATALAEIAFLAPNPEETMDRITSDSEDIELHALGQRDLSSALQRMLSADEEQERLDMLDLARKMLRLLKLQRGDAAPPAAP